MLAEIITIGDEILIGQIIDSNSAFIGAELNKIGVTVHQITSIQDQKEHILSALKEAEDRVDIVIVTGGLGPTKDDVTKSTLCSYFDDELIENKDVLKQVKYLFEKVYQKPVSPINLKQALVPSKADILHNEYGTAPGIHFKKNGTLFFSLPGVPYEMKALISDKVLPIVKDRFELPTIIHKTLLTHGLGESAIAERISDFEDNLPSCIKLAYLPSSGRVRLRLSGKHNDGQKLNQNMNQLVDNLIGLVEDIFVGLEEDGSLEQLIGGLLKDRRKTMAVAESCTGGMISERITKHAGASKFYNGGVIAYATEVKKEVLNVSEQLISEHTVVSEEVAEAMALGVQKCLNADYAIATTGNAGPSKGESDEEVGTVCIGIATPNGAFAKKFNFGKNRERVIIKAVNTAFELLQKEILKN